MNVLLVGQNADLLDILTYALRRRGFVPHTAGYGASALLRLRVVRPTVLVFDDGGLAYSGLTTLRRLQAELPIPYLWLTLSDDADPVRLAPGCLAVLQKPFGLDDLIAHLHVFRSGTFDAGLDTLQSPAQAFASVPDWADKIVRGLSWIRARLGERRAFLKGQRDDREIIPDSLPFLTHYAHVV